MRHLILGIADLLIAFIAMTGFLTIHVAQPVIWSFIVIAVALWTAVTGVLHLVEAGR